MGHNVQNWSMTVVHPVKLSWDELHRRRYTHFADATQLNSTSSWVELCCYKRPLTHRRTTRPMSMPLDHVSRNFEIKYRPTINVLINSHLPRQGGRYTIGAVCLLFFCLSVSRITAKVISRFYWNLMLGLGLSIGRTDQLLVVIRFPDMDSDHSSTSLSITE